MSEAAVKEEGQIYWTEVRTPEDLTHLIGRLKQFAEIADSKQKRMVVKILFK